MDVDLRELDEPLLANLLDAAVAGADPLEVMPPVEDVPGWTEKRRDAFLAFHRERSVATSEPVETTWAIVLDGTVVGAARLEPVRGAGDRVVEAGIWVGRGVRGTGVGRSAMSVLLTRARADGVRVVAETTEDNAGAVALLRGLGATARSDGDAVHAQLPTLEP